MPRRSRKAARNSLLTSYEAEGKEDDIDDMTLGKYENRRYTVLEIAEAQDFFHQLNPNSGPYITKGEFHANMHRIVPTASHEVRELLRHFLDKNDDDRIDESEFVASWGFMKEQIAAIDSIDTENKTKEGIANVPGEKMEELRTVYEAIDKDKNGVISSIEFRESMHKIMGCE